MNRSSVKLLSYNLHEIQIYIILYLLWVYSMYFMYTKDNGKKQ